MDIAAEAVRDSTRDVLAMVRACDMLQEELPDPDATRQDLEVLFGNADPAMCLRVSVSMLASTWKRLSELTALTQHTTAQSELDNIFASFLDTFA